jgi:hypothetical protein
MGNLPDVRFAPEAVVPQPPNFAKRPWTKAVIGGCRVFADFGSRVDFPHCEWRACPPRRTAGVWPATGPEGLLLLSSENEKGRSPYGDLREGGKRASTIRVSIGNARETLTRTARAIAKEYSAQISRGRHPKGVEQSESTSAGRNTGSNVPTARLP